MCSPGQYSLSRGWPRGLRPTLARYQGSGIYSSADPVHPFPIVPTVNRNWGDFDRHLALALREQLPAKLRFGPPEISIKQGAEDFFTAGRMERRFRSSTNSSIRGAIWRHLKAAPGVVPQVAHDYG